MFKKIFNNRNEDSYVIVGLGNIGPEYDGTRHNMGFMAIDALAKKLGISVTKHKYQGILGEGKYEGRKVALVKPSTYMNLSGNCVSQIMNRYKISEDRLIVIYDDIDIAAGLIRVRSKGSAGSHNGMKSVLSVTETDEFPRVRIGIGKNPPDTDLVKYVLGHIGKEEADVLKKAVDKAAEAALIIIKDGIERAMSICNGN